jgi:hypothetical protein
MTFDERIGNAVEALIQQLRGPLELELRSLLDELTASAARDREAMVADARAEAEADAERRITAAVADSEAEHADRVSAALAAAEVRHDQTLGQSVTEAHVAERQTGLARIERLLAAVRALDHTRSLSETLDSLAGAAGQEASRAAVLIVRGDRLRGWRLVGFGPQSGDARSIDLSLDEAGVVAAALRSGQACITSAQSPAPAKIGVLPPNRVGLAVPVVVGGQAVAVVYADDVAEREIKDVAEREIKEDARVPSPWPEVVEILARHAARCLEALTAQKAVAAGLTSTAGASGQSARAASAEQDPAEAARRYARLLVSEIKLYHETEVQAGRRERNLLQRLGPEIDRMRRLFRERVPLAANDYFEEELVRTLADGDPALLGQPT